MIPWPMGGRFECSQSLITGVDKVLCERLVF